MKKLYTTIILFSTYAFFAQVPTTGLIGAWPFNGNANDESPNNNNGVVYGAMLTTDHFNQMNKAYSFNGTTDYIKIPYNSALTRFNTDFTISAWIRRTIQPQGFTQPIFTNRTTNSGSELCIDGLGNGYEGYLSYVVYNGSVLQFARSTAPLSINNGYQHVVLTYKNNGGNNNTVKLYVNGMLDNTITGLIDIPFSNADTYIGWSPFFTNSNRHFNGDIDDIYTYDRELNATEILGIYNTSNVGLEETTNLSFNVYPNPTVGNVFIEVSGVDFFNGYVELTNIMGQLVRRNEIGFEEKIKISIDGPEGVYVLNIYNKEFIRMKSIKVIKR
jgi:hypothetical protein